MNDRVIVETSMTEEKIEYTTDAEVLAALKEEFPADQLKTLSGKFQYIPEPIVRKRLEDVLGLNWDWEVVTEVETTFKGKAAVVIRGRLSFRLPSGQLVVREAHGGSALDNGYRAGDAYKSAGSNALKKAAYLMGIGSYLGLNNAEGIDDTTSWGNNSTQGGQSNAATQGWAALPTQAPAAPQGGPAAAVYGAQPVAPAAPAAPLGGAAAPGGAWNTKI